MTDLGDASNYLGVEIHQKKGGIFINQAGYIHKLLEKFGMKECNLTRIPANPNIPVQKDMGTGKYDPMLYRSLVGSLLFITYTRPNICYAVSSVSRCMQEPETAHFQITNKILHYLSETINHGIFLSSENSNPYHAYADADWRCDIDTRRSISGILHKIGDSTIH